MTPRQKITTALWFQDDAEKAIAFYLSVFKDAKILSETRWGEGGPFPKGSLMAAWFQLAGQDFVAINGRPETGFSEAISLMVSCENQAEIDHYWEKLTAGGGEPGQCGWLEDKFGVSWQVVPKDLSELLADKDPARAQRVTGAMMQMTKLDIARLRAAHAGK